MPLAVDAEEVEGCRSKPAFAGGCREAHHGVLVRRGGIGYVRMIAEMLALF
jgi:hypothetical protein